MIQLHRQVCPSELTDEVKNQLTEEFQRDMNKTVWNKAYIRKGLMASSLGKCSYCECKVGPGHADMHIDHYLPKVKYPDHVVDWDNLIPACPDCNRSKSDHDTEALPIVNPFRQNPKEFFYLRDYRYKYKEGNNKEIAARTLDILGLNDTQKKVMKRFQIGEELHMKIESLADIAQSNRQELSINVAIRNKVKRGCRDILRFGVSDAEYAAFMATIIYNDNDYWNMRSALVESGQWDEELEQCERLAFVNVFDTNRAS